LENIDYLTARLLPHLTTESVSNLLFFFSPLSINQRDSHFDELLHTGKRFSSLVFEIRPSVEDHKQESARTVHVNPVRLEVRQNHHSKTKEQKEKQGKPIYDISLSKYGPVAIICSTESASDKPMLANSRPLEKHGGLASLPWNASFSFGEVELAPAHSPG